jgi:hypothetical protein
MALASDLDLVNVPKEHGHSPLRYSYMPCEFIESLIAIEVPYLSNALCDSI